MLDDRIGGMESLDVLRISGNPLRDKKFSGMNTEDLKRALKARMEPEEEIQHEREESQATEYYSAPKYVQCFHCVSCYQKNVSRD